MAPAGEGKNKVKTAKFYLLTLPKGFGDFPLHADQSKCLCRRLPLREPGDTKKLRRKIRLVINWHMRGPAPSPRADFVCDFTELPADEFSYAIAQGVETRFRQPLLPFKQSGPSSRHSLSFNFRLKKRHEKLNNHVNRCPLPYDSTYSMTIYYCFLIMFIFVFEFCYESQPGFFQK